MNIKDIGIDVESIDRFRKMPYKKHKSFYDKIFTEKELSYCLAKKDPYPHFAARFAAKEAAAKAIGKSVYHAKSIEIVNRKDGKPELKLKDVKGRALVSLTHSGEYAAAIVLWQN